MSPFLGSLLTLLYLVRFTILAEQVDQNQQHLGQQVGGLPRFHQRLLSSDVQVSVQRSRRDNILQHIHAAA